MINLEDTAERGQGEVATLGYLAAVKRGAKTGCSTAATARLCDR
jgi:hypothetical protein